MWWMALACAPKVVIEVHDPWGAPVEADVVAGARRPVRAREGTAAVSASETSARVQAKGHISRTVAIEGDVLEVTLWPEPNTSVVALGRDAYTNVPAQPLDRLDPPGWIDPVFTPAETLLIEGDDQEFEVCPLVEDLDFDAHLICPNAPIDVVLEVLEGWTRVVLPDGRALAVSRRDGHHPVRGASP